MVDQVTVTIPAHIALQILPFLTGIEVGSITSDAGKAQARELGRTLIKALNEQTTEEQGAIVCAEAFQMSGRYQQGETNPSTTASFTVEHAGNTGFTDWLEILRKLNPKSSEIEAEEWVIEYRMGCSPVTALGIRGLEVVPDEDKADG